VTVAAALLALPYPLVRISWALALEHLGRLLGHQTLATQ